MSINLPIHAAFPGVSLGREGGASQGPRQVETAGFNCTLSPQPQAET
jgi:hypothetical protein